jgi:hypothetical protein
MFKGIKTGELVKNGAEKVANHKAVDKAFQKGLDKAADKAIGAVFTFVTGGAAVAIKRKRDKRKERRDAADLARQVGRHLLAERHHRV